MKHALLCLAAAAGCSSSSLTVSLHVPGDQHPLQLADRVWLSLIDHAGQTRLARDGAPTAEALELDGIQPAAGWVLALQATFAGDPVASGRSCPFDLSAGSTPPEVPLYFGLVSRFAPTSPPPLARIDAAAFLDGATPVLAGGSSPDGTALATSDTWDAVAGRFGAGPTLTAARTGARTVTLPDGPVLILGGAAPGAVAVERISQGKATPLPTTFPADWVEHAAVAFPDGTALITGGHAAGAAPTALTFRVTQGGSSIDPTTPLLQARARHTATLLGGGGAAAAAIIAGGRDASGPVDTIELYTVSGGFSPSGDLLEPRYDHTATLLPGGLVLIVGGVGADGKPVGRAELVDPVQRISRAAGVLRTPRAQHTATLLESGRVLIAGGVADDGQATASVELFDPALGPAGDFVAAQPMSSPRAGHAVLPACDGTLLVAGGADGAELYTPLP